MIDEKVRDAILGNDTFFINGKPCNNVKILSDGLSFFLSENDYEDGEHDVSGEARIQTTLDNNDISEELKEIQFRISVKNSDVTIINGIFITK